MEYTTIRAGVQAEYVEKKSRFLGFLQPVDTVEAAEAFVAQIRHAHPDARHHVFAWIIPGAERCSDDGEPSGTAGQPVLSVLRRRGFSRIAAVVVRYFGGVLLGAPGLVRAYGHAASMAADAAEPVALCLCKSFVFSCGYPELSAFERLTRRIGYIRDIAYAESVTFSLSVPSERVNRFLREMTECSRGQIIPEEQGDIYEETAAFQS